ncbi:MAG TPA: NADP-dependent oxidoreductase [Geobacteraceae bacterium]|nr:NADP-dependent oxidoreductase [Geobacteraceae bacterium]
MHTMKAVRIHTYGGPEVLVYEEVPRPQPGQGEVLVRVEAAAVNPVDWKIREGYLREMLPHALPLIMGWDVSGVVEETGPGVTRFRAGDEVFSRPDLLRDGTYAEYVVIRETEVALKPGSVDHLHAAAIPLAGLTAWKSLIEAAGAAPGQRVLIHGAAGGVGSYAVQLAKWRGAHVTATASAPNLDYLRRLGADEIIDYRSVRFEDVTGDVDVVIDTIGGDTQQRSWQVLKRGGILVSIISPPPPEQAAAHGVRQAFVFIQPDAAVLAELAKLVDAGKLRPYVEAVLPLAEARRAQELSQGGHVRGKIVLKVV